MACINIKGKLSERLPRLAEIMNERNLEILILTETKISFEIQEMNIGQDQYYVASKGNQYVGVGVMSRIPITYEFIGQRTIIVKVDSHALVGVHAPHELAKGQEGDKYYQQLTELIQSKQPAAVLGDFNAGPEPLSKKMKTTNFKRLQHLLSTTQYQLLNHGPTWKATNSPAVRTLDHILIRSNLKAQNTEVSWCNIADHALAETQLVNTNVRFRRHKRPYYNRKVKQPEWDPWFDFSKQVSTKKNKEDKTTNPLNMFWNLRKSKRPQTSYTLVNEKGEEIPRNKHVSEIADSFRRIWQQHPKQQPRPAQSNTPTKPPTTAEIIRAIAILKNGKARGPDGVTAEDLKGLDMTGAEKLTEIIAEIWKQEKVPESWVRLKTVPLPKGTKITKKDWRPITIEPVILKLLNTIILHRIKDKAESTLHPNQFGCRTGVGCADAVRVLIDAALKAKSSSEDYVLISTDFSKAFDSVHHEVLLSQVDKFDDRTILNILRSQYEQLVTKVTMAGHQPELVKIINGILQGDPLSPILFVMAISSIHEELDKSCSRTTVVSSVDDFLAVVPKDQIHNYIHIIEQTATTIGLSLNRIKCKIVPLGEVHGLESPTVDEVPVTNSITFLGIIINSNLEWKCEVERRLKKTEKALREIRAQIRLYNGQESSKLSQKEILIITLATTICHLKYIEQALTLTAEDKAQLDEAECKCFRSVLEIPEARGLSDEDVLEEVERIRAGKETKGKKEPKAPPLPKQPALEHSKEPTQEEIENRKAYIKRHEDNRNVCQVCGQKFTRANAHRGRTCKAPLYGTDIQCQTCKRWNTLKQFPLHHCVSSTGSIINEDELDWTRHDQRGLEIPDIGKVPGRSYCKFDCGKHFACKSSSLYHERHICTQGPKLLKPKARQQPGNSAKIVLVKKALPFKCADCDESFHSEKGLNNHRKRWCKVLHPRQQLKCPHPGCTETADTTQSLTCHMKTHK